MPNKLPEDWTRMSLALPREELARLKRIAEAEGTTQSEIVRNLLEQYGEEKDVSEKQIQKKGGRKK